ncbi:MAG: nitroreductase family protein [Anaerolineae bacterium]|nr:nitroreductase family protein [Anaerolineae bacterium]
MARKAVYESLDFERLDISEQQQRSDEFLQRMLKRRSVRHFSSEPAPISLIENAIRVAGSAPSGANQQPWTFAVISDPALKRKIRLSAEAEEKESYERRMTPEWLEALAVLGTDWRKPHIEDAPYVIVVFRQAYGIRRADDDQDERVMHYYSDESVGIAVGFLLAALHISGLATLTHTPSPMKFLAEILGRPANERPFVLIPVGYPAEDAEVPVISKKALADIMVRH